VDPYAKKGLKMNKYVVLRRRGSAGSKIWVVKLPEKSPLLFRNVAIMEVCNYVK
jgi:hypothetical protein